MKTTKKIPCAACNESTYEEVEVCYETTAADGVRIVIPKVKLLRCPKCGDELIPPTSQAEIDRAIAEQTEQLSARELEQIADKFDLDQTQISEVLGLGGKTFHRWLKGTQYPSRSMGYYLRVLAEFPEAFSWLKERSWRKSNRIFNSGSLSLSEKFPDLAWLNSQTSLTTSNLDQQSLLESEEGCRFNPASVFSHTKIT